MKLFCKLANEQPPDISVVIPTYNRVAMLEEALNSILSQTFLGTVEIIVVDDCSTDNTSKIVQQKYPQVNLITLDQNSGVSVARNTGIGHASGDYIAFLDSDDLWEPTYLETQFQAVKRHPSCFCASGIINFDTVSNTRDMRSQKPDLTSFVSLEHQLLVRGSCIYTPSSVIFPRAILNSVDLFDQTLRFGEDTDLYLRCLRQGYDVHFTELPLVIRRKHTMGQAIETKTLDLRKDNRLNLAKKHYPALENSIFKAPRKTFNHLCVEICMTFATKYFDEKCYLNWLSLSLNTFKYGCPRFIARNMVWNMKKLLT